MLKEILDRMIVVNETTKIKFTFLYTDNFKQNWYLYEKWMWLDNQKFNSWNIYHESIINKILIKESEVN